MTAFGYILASLPIISSWKITRFRFFPQKVKFLWILALSFFHLSRWGGWFMSHASPGETVAIPYGFWWMSGTFLLFSKCGNRTTNNDGEVRSGGGGGGVLQKSTVECCHQALALYFYWKWKVFGKPWATLGFSTDKIILVGLTQNPQNKESRKDESCRQNGGDCREGNQSLSQAKSQEWEMNDGGHKQRRLGRWCRVRTMNRAELMGKIQVVATGVVGANPEEIKPKGPNLYQGGRRGRMVKNKIWSELHIPRPHYS